MKQIRIGVKNEIIELFDDNSDPVEEYATKLSEILQASNMVIVDATSGSAILRPSKINSIDIKDTDTIIEASDHQLTIPEDLAKEADEHEDIITDGD